MAFKSNPEQGFTLVEVLVALVVLAAIGVTLLQTSDTGTNHSRYLQQKLLASWVAEDRATALRIANRLGRPLSFDDVLVLQGGERFLSKVIPVKQTEWLQRIEIQVFYLPEVASVASNTPLYRLTCYLPLMSVPEASQGGV